MIGPVVKAVRTEGYDISREQLADLEELVIEFIEFSDRHLKHLYTRHFNHIAVWIDDFSQAVVFQISCSKFEIEQALAEHQVFKICDKLLIAFEAWKAAFEKLTTWQIVHANFFVSVITKSHGDDSFDFNVGPQCLLPRPELSDPFDFECNAQQVETYLKRAQASFCWSQQLNGLGCEDVAFCRERLAEMMKIRTYADLK